MIQMKNKIIEFLTNKKILILGFGREGKSVYNFIKENNIKYKSLGIADKNEIDIDNVEKHCGDNYLDSTKDYDLVILAPQVANYYEDLKKDTDRLGIKSAACEGKKYIELTRNPQKALEFVFSILDGNNE